MTKCVLIHTDNVLEYWINEKPYFGGDFYAYRNSPLVLSLEPGRHKIDLRLIRDVRARGGGEPPAIEVLVHVQESVSELAIDTDKLLVSDMVDGKLASTLACVPVRNEGSKWIDILNVDVVNVSVP